MKDRLSQPLMTDLENQKTPETPYTVPESLKFSGKDFVDQNNQTNKPIDQFQKHDIVSELGEATKMAAVGAAAGAYYGGRGIAATGVQAGTGVIKAIDKLVYDGGAFISDIMLNPESAKWFREKSRGVDELAEAIKEWNVKNILGEDFKGDDGDYSSARMFLGAAEELGGLYGLGKLASAASMVTKTGGAGPLAAIMGVEAYEESKSAAEAQGKELDARQEAGAAINGAAAIATAGLFGKISGLVGKEKAKRVIDISYKNFLKTASLDVFEGGVIGAGTAVAGEVADDVANGIDAESDTMAERAKRVLMSAAAGGALVGATKVVPALGAWVKEQRQNLANAAALQGEKALSVVGRGLPLVKGSGVEDVRAVTVNGEVIFNNNTVYRPARPERRIAMPQGGYRVVPAKAAEIQVSDGTILNLNGEVVGVRAGPWKKVVNGGEVETPAEYVYRSTDPEAAQKWRIVDAKTGEVVDLGAIEKLPAPDSVRQWMAAPANAKPQLDADGQAFMKLYLQAHAENVEISKAALLAMERVKLGKLKVTEAADLVDDAVAATMGEAHTFRANSPKAANPTGEANVKTPNATTARPATALILGNLEPLGVVKPEVRANGSANLTTVRAAERLVDWVNDGTIKPTEVDVTEIQAGENTNPNGPLIVREDLGGVKAVISGAVPEGAATVEAVVVRESDGWGVDEAKTISDVVKLQNPDITVTEAVEAVSRLSIENQEIADVIGGEAPAVVQAAERIVDNAAPSIRSRVTVENAEMVTQLSDTVNLKTVGEGWQDKQSALFDTMPADATPLEVNVAGRVTLADKTIKPEEAWEIAAWAVANAHVPGVIDNVNNPKALRELMANDSAGNIPIEQPDGSFKTVNEIEAKSLGGIEATLPPMPEVDHSLDLTSVANRPGTFATARFPDVNVTIGQSDDAGKVWVVEGLTPQMMLEPRAREDMGRFLADLAEKAGAAGAQIDVGDPALVELAGELVANHYDTKRASAMKARQGAVENLLTKSGLVNKVVSNVDEFNAKLESLPNGKAYRKDGKTWGFYDPNDGNVYLNGSLFGTKTGLGVTIHEFAHPAVMATKKVNRPLYDRGMELAAKVPLYSQLKSDPAYGKMSEETLREEVLVHILQGRLEDIKSQVPAKIYKEIEDFVNQFWRRFGEANGIRDLTPAMVATMTIEDVTDAIGAEMMSGRPFGEKQSSARSASENGDEYSYNALTQRPDMTLTQINPANFKNYSSDAQRVRDAKDSVLAAGGRRIDGAVVIKMDGSDVVVSSSGIKHRGKKPHRENDMLYPVLGEVLKNAIPVNELAPRSGEKKDSLVNNTFVFLGAFAYKNEICPVRIQVVQKNRTKKLDSIDVLKSLNTKIGKVNAPDKSDLTREAPSALAEFGKIDAPDKSDLTREAPSALAKISIANLIDVAQPLHPEIFSKDVTDVLKVPYEGKKINARFSIGGIYTGSAADYANRSRQGGVDDGPSLVKIGSGEGTQVYGHGLYGSTLKNDAEYYAAKAQGNYVPGRGDGRQHIYEQTFFTNRPKGDESHLLLWYEPVSEANKKRIDNALIEISGNPMDWDGVFTGEDLYRKLATFASPKEASEFLAQNADIDGIKYPAEDHHGRSIGKEEGWNYVSFRDDNIRVDHKWTDGVARFSRGVLKRSGKDGKIVDVDQQRLTAVMRGLETGELKHPRFTREEFAASKGVRHERLWSYLLSLESPEIHAGGGQGLDGGKGGNDSQGSKGMGLVRRVATRYGSNPEEVIASRHKYFDKGVESKVYVTGGDTVIKVRKLNAYDLDGVKHELAKIVYHNYLFPNDAYTLRDIAVWNKNGYDQFYLIVEQPLVRPKTDANGNIIAPSEEAILKALNSAGRRFSQWDEAWNRRAADVDDNLYSSNDDFSSDDFVASGRKMAYNDEFVVYDFKPGRNTFIDAETGEIRFIDPRVDINDPGAGFSVSKFGKRKIDNRSMSFDGSPSNAGRVRFLHPTSPMGREVFVAGRARVVDDAERGERLPGVIAASAELSGQIHTPISQAAQMRTVSLPVSEIEWLRKQLTGNVIPTELKRRLPNKRAREGKIVLAADVFGLVDKTDMAEVKTQLKANGYFRNEDPLWCSDATANDIALEEKRSEDALADKLIELGDDRVSGREAGGVSAARGVFADQVAQVILDLPANAPGTTGAMRKLGDAFLRNVRGFDAEADNFLDWAYGPASAPRTSRERAGQMLGAFMVMPQEIRNRAPNYMTAIADMITNDPRLEHAWRQLSLRGLSNQAHTQVALDIEKSFSRAHDEAVAKIVAEGNEPIEVGKWKSKKPSDWIDRVKDNIIVGFSDTMGTVAVRIDARVRAYVKAKKKVIKQTKDPQIRKQIEEEINRFMGAIGQMKNQIELSRTAYERGAWNEDLTYLYKMRDLEDVANLKWGLTESDKVMYLNLKRVIETEGRSGSRGITPRQAQMQLDDMKARLGGAKWQSLENYGNQFHAIIDQDFLSDPRLERMFGKGWVDYCKSQVNYVTAKRIWSQEELDAIELAREDARRRGVAGGDDVVEQMYAYGQKAGAMTDQLVGSMADTADVRGATWEKHMAIKQAVRRNQLVLDLRDALTKAGVEGVRDVRRGESAFPENKRYGHINYLLNGQKRTLIVPKEIADGFKVNPQSANLLGTLAMIARSGYIDWNPGFRLINNPIYDQSAYVWKMPGAREPIAQTALKWTVPGGDAIFGIVSQWMARKVPGFASLFGKDTIFRYFPEAKAAVDYLRAPEKWMEKFMKAEKARDWKKMRKLQDARDNALGALKANMFLPANSQFLAGKSEGFANDVMNAKGIKTTAQREEQELAKSKTRKVLEWVNIFKRNKAGIEADDMITKMAAYLHDRIAFGNVRTPQESGVLVKKNIATPDVVRRGKHTRIIQGWVFQFFNAAEKGLEGYYRSAKDNPKGFWSRFSNVFGARLVAVLATGGVIWKAMLDDNDGDEEKAKKKYGSLYDYAKWRYRAGQNVSKYMKENYSFTPVWMSEDGLTTISLAGVVSMEDKLITPWADYVAQSIAAKYGLAEDPSLVDAVAKSTIKSVVPDMALATPQWKIIQDGILSWYDNPYDHFYGRDTYDKDSWAARFDSGTDLKRFSVDVGMRLWNDFGGRALWEFDTTKSGDERNAAPENVRTVLNKIPGLSPVLRRMVKVSVGSPEKRGEMIEETYQKRLRIIRLCAKKLLKAETTGEWLFKSDPKKYDAMKADMMKAYGLDEYAWLEIEAKYINTSNERAYWKDEDLKEYNQLRKKADKLGIDPADVDFMLGDE